MKSHETARGDEGFTLIELLVVLVIMPIVVGGLVAMLFVVFESQTGVSNKLTGASDTTVAASIVTQDVESAAAVTTEATPACGTTGTQILGVKSSTTSNITSYVVVQNGTKYELFREQCTSVNTTTPFGQTLVSANVPSSLAATVTCSATCTTASTWEYGASISQVALSINETSTGATYAITAVPRLWNAASVGLASQEDPFPIPPLDILSTASCASPSLSLSGNATIVVAEGAGSADDNSSCTDSITASGNAVVTATSIETGDSTPSTAYTKSANASFPSVVYSAPTSDPFSGLSAPTNPTATGSGTCSSSSYSCTPGNYSAAVNFSGTSSWTVDAGTYVFDQPVTISGNANASFGAGTYLFEEGLAITGNGTVSFGTGTYIFEATTSTGSALAVSGNGIMSSGAGGTLFYVESGVLAFSGNGDVSLSGLPAYDGIAMWQASTDTNSATLSGNSGVNDAYGGIYFPHASVGPSGNASVSASFVVTDGVNFSGNSQLDVG